MSTIDRSIYTLWRTFYQIKHHRRKMPNKRRGQKFHCAKIWHPYKAIIKAVIFLIELRGMIYWLFIRWETLWSFCVIRHKAITMSESQVVYLYFVRQTAPYRCSLAPFYVRCFAPISRNCRCSLPYRILTYIGRNSDLLGLIMGRLGRTWTSGLFSAEFSLMAALKKLLPWRP